MVVTGKGPEREKYMKEVEELQSGRGGSKERWKWVRCVSMWLEPEDYPVLLGAFDFHLFRTSFVLKPLLLFRFSRPGHLVAFQFVCFGPPDEGGRYVWMRTACLRAGLCVVCDSTLSSRQGWVLTVYEMIVWTNS